MFSQIAVAGVAYVAGAFTPAVGRKIKSLFVKESKIVITGAKGAVINDVKLIEAAVAKKV